MIGDILNEQYNTFSNWVTQTPVPKIIDSVTYDTYESENPFRIDFFGNKPFENKFIKKTVNIAQNTGAEIYSAYTNPFYLTHKIVNIPTYYKNAVNAYKNIQTKGEA